MPRAWSSARAGVRSIRELSIEQNENRNQRTTGPISFGRELSIEQHRKGQCTVHKLCVHTTTVPVIEL
jgi:hypothetical protein